ncbi:MAG TPA: protein kinase [Oculatellaceae cyanobacterium]|jgi:serine/threonine protein kinase
MTHQPGQKIQNGRYQIKNSLGAGSFGCTYLAEDRDNSGKIVVIKQLLPQPLTVAEIVKDCFRQEASTMKRLGGYKQQIPKILDDFEENEQFYLVQEYIEGNDLEKELRSYTFNEQEVIQILNDVLQVLDYVHSQGVIHRDIKPANLIRRTSDSKIVVIDFGAVKEVMTLALNPENQTISTKIIGTPWFMPPEQAMGRPHYVSDIYALGITAYRLLTKKAPKENQQNDPILDWSGVKVSPKLKKIIENMTRYDFAKRYPSAKKVLDHLNHDPSNGGLLKKCLLASSVIFICLLARIIYVKIQYDKASALLIEAVKLQDRGNFRSAINNNLQVKQIYPPAGFQVDANLCHLYGKVGEFHTQIAYCQVAVQQSPNHSNSWNNYGLAQHSRAKNTKKQIDYIASLASFDQAIKLDCNFQATDPEEQKEANENCGLDLINKSEVLVDLNRFNEGNDVLNQSISKLYGNKKASHLPYYHLGKLNTKKKLYQKAINYFQQCLKIKPDFKPAKEERERVLKLLQG